MLKYSVGDLVKIASVYYIIDKVSETSGYPSAVWVTDKLGQVKEGRRVITCDREEGWAYENWEQVSKLSPENLKYAKIIRKIEHLDRKFKERNNVTVNSF